MIPCNYKLLSFLAEALNKIFEDHIQGRRLDLNFILKGLKSALLSHPLWVTLYIDILVK